MDTSKNRGQRHLVYSLLLGYMVAREPHEKSKDFICPFCDIHTERCILDYEVPLIYEPHAKYFRNLWEVTNDDLVRFKLRSIPEPFYKMQITVNHVANLLECFRIPGFYHHENMWRVNLPEQGAVRPYFNEKGLIQGLLVYHHSSGTWSKPYPLNSSGKVFGSNAVEYNPIYDPINKKLNDDKDTLF